jgi:carboxyl-terminal processing protease
VARLQDPVLQSSITRLRDAEALRLYDEIITLVLSHYAHRETVDLEMLFRRGLQEMQWALEDRQFIQRYLSRARPADLENFRSVLLKLAGEKVPTQASAVEKVRQLTVAGQQWLRLKPGLVALELACGACNSLDEYSLYLGPRRFLQANTAQKARHVGVGFELSVSNGRLEISRVYKKSPADNAGLSKGDRLVRINDQVVSTLAPDVAAALLLGEAGSTVSVQIIPRGEEEPLVFKLERQAVLPTSVDYERLGDPMDSMNAIGYVQIHHFQESTVQEVKEALEALTAMPIKGLIVDLRGNPGGLFKPAVAVAELFLSTGVIVHTQSRLKDFNKTFKAMNMNPFAPSLPIVVLIDGETASSAEIVAGALKDNQRATLVGQTSYGKGSIQGFLPLTDLPGGLRLTIARFTSPSQQVFEGRGLVPDRQVNDTDPDAALKVAEELIRLGMR